MGTLEHALESARARYVAANPQSMAADKAAQHHMPGGNTRTVLHYEPFPLTMVAGEGAEVIDLDGHRYVDFVGEFSAGLFGHSNETIKSAIRQALDDGIVMGAPTPRERKLADILCSRFPSLEQVRFCNSGTEANIMALTTARMATGREKLLAFHGAYHGGVIKFPTGNSTFNIPFDYLLAEYNDVVGTANIIRRAGNELAAVLVEPILGAGGNIPGSRVFLEMLRRETSKVGALLIFDEVKTARIGPAGMQGLLGISPDLITLGKIIGGGLPLGAFGGRTDLMELYNPRLPGAWKHAGTFNNNVCSMAAGCAAMGEVFTPNLASEFLDSSEVFRMSLNEMFAAKAVSMYCNGLGSMFAIHFSNKPIERPVERTAASKLLSELMHMEMLLDGILICSRGDMFQSLPMNATQRAKARNALSEFIDRHRLLIG